MVDSVSAGGGVGADGAGAQVLHENAIFSVYRSARYHYIEFNRCKRGAVVVPQFANGDFLLVCLQRAPIFGISPEFPRGGVEPGEDAATGAVRELEEETGYVVDVANLIHLGRVGPDTAALNHTSEVYLAPIGDDLVPEAFDTEEIDRTWRVSAAELRTLLRDGKIIDGHTLAAYTLLMLR